LQEIDAAGQNRTDTSLRPRDFLYHFDFGRRFRVRGLDFVFTMLLSSLGGPYKVSTLGLTA